MRDAGMDQVCTGGKESEVLSWICLLWESYSYSSRDTHQSTEYTWLELRKCIHESADCTGHWKPQVWDYLDQGSQTVACGQIRTPPNFDRYTAPFIPSCIVYRLFCATPAELSHCDSGCVACKILMYCLDIYTEKVCQLLTYRRVEMERGRLRTGLWDLATSKKSGRAGEYRKGGWEGAMVREQENSCFSHLHRSQPEDALWILMESN